MCDARCIVFSLAVSLQLTLHPPPLHSELCYCCHAPRALAAQVYVAGTEEFQEFASEAKSIITWRCWVSNGLFALARFIRGSIDDEQCPTVAGDLDAGDL